MLVYFDLFEFPALSGHWPEISIPTPVSAEAQGTGSVSGAEVRAQVACNANGPDGGAEASRAGQTRQPPSSAVPGKRLQGTDRSEVSAAEPRADCTPAGRFDRDCSSTGQGELPWRGAPSALGAGEQRGNPA